MIPQRYAYQRNEEAEYAFERLGTAAAVPALIRIHENNVSPSSQRCVAQALAAGTIVARVTEFWNNTPRAPLCLYRRNGGTPGMGQFLGKFEALEMPPPPAKANVPTNRLCCAPATT